MSKALLSSLLVAFFATIMLGCASSPTLSDPPDIEVVGFHVTHVAGDVDDILIEFPDESLSDDLRYPIVFVGMKIPEGTTVETGPDSSIRIAMLDEAKVEIPGTSISVRHTSNIKFARCLISGEDDIWVLRLKVKTGEIEFKEPVSDLLEVKIATPNSTASLTSGDVGAISYSNAFGTETKKSQLIPNGVERPSSNLGGSSSSDDEDTNPDSGPPKSPNGE